MKAAEISGALKAGVMPIACEDEEAGGFEGDTLDVPCKAEVCGVCDGRGSYVNPAIDGHGITAEEWNGPDWDDDSRQAYLSGGYDVQCAECHGLRVVPVPDLERCDDAQKAAVAAYEQHLQDVARWDDEDRHTRRMESGGFE